MSTIILANPDDDQPNPGNEQPQQQPDPFDPAALRLSQNFREQAQVRNVITVVRCRKPHRQEFVRIRSGDENRLNTLLFEDKVRGEIYVVGQSLREHLRAEAYPACLFTAITRQNDVFLLPVKLPAYDGKTNSWNESALAAVQLAVSKWVRIASNMSAGMYDVDEALGDLGAPVWPELSFRDILKLCFKDRLIESLDHPVLRSLRGEI